MFTAEAEVTYTTNENERGYNADCVFVECRRSGVRVGPIWGHGPRSVTRALSTLTQECSCAAKYHVDRDDPSVFE